MYRREDAFCFPLPSFAPWNLTCISHEGQTPYGLGFLFSSIGFAQLCFQKKRSCLHEWWCGVRCCCIRSSYGQFKSCPVASTLLPFFVEFQMLGPWGIYQTLLALVWWQWNLADWIFSSFNRKGRMNGDATVCRKRRQRILPLPPTAQTFS